ncbi:MAG: N-acetylmuramoyl-L-alanine amidase [Rhizomicrobium sp.]
MAVRIVERPSPNHDERPQGAPIDMLLLHYTGMKTAQEALSRLCDAQAKVSAHYTIDCDGRIYAHVPEARRAWHAGVSYWAGERNVNARSIGIEIVNPGHEFGYEPFATPQIGALMDLAGEILARHPIPAHRVLGHSDVAPARRQDPGELFPWAQLAEFGIGLWPFSGFGPTETDAPLAADFENNLRRFGYGIAPDVDVSLEAVVTAFQRHWRPSNIDGVIDDESAYRLGALVSTLS